MQTVEAMIKPSRLEEIKRALREIGINSVTVSQERGGAMQPTAPEKEIVAQMKINIVVEAPHVERLLAVIAEHATAFPFVFLNVLGCASPAPSVNITEAVVNKTPTLPLKWPPEPAL